MAFLSWLEHQPFPAWLQRILPRLNIEGSSIGPGAAVPEHDESALAGAPPRRQRQGVAAEGAEG